MRRTINTLFENKKLVRRTVLFIYLVWMSFAVYQHFITPGILNAYDSANFAVLAGLGGFYFGYYTTGRIKEKNGE